MIPKRLLLIVITLFSSQLCFARGGAGSLPDSSQRKAVSRDGVVPSACQVTVDQAHRYIQSKSALLVDVRSEESYLQSTLPGAINIPLYAVKTKSYLKGKHLILFDDGSDPQQLVKECRRLISKNGMKISVLKGGIRQWNNGGKGKGILYSLTPDDYLASKNANRWLLINASGNADAATIFEGTDVVDVTRILFGDGGEIAANIKQHKDIVVLTDHGEKSKQLSSLQQIFDQPIYLLVGGVKGYIDFQNNRKRFLSRLERGPVKAVQCVK